MINKILNNESLKNFIETVNIDSDQKESLISKIPYLNEEERIKLFNLLVDLHLMEIEKKESLNMIDKYWID